MSQIPEGIPVTPHEQLLLQQLFTAMISFPIST